MYLYLKARAGHQQKKKINVKRQTTNNQHPENQKPTTTESDSRHSTVSSRQPTPDNRQQTTTTDCYNTTNILHQQPTADTQQPTEDKKYRKIHG